MIILNDREGHLNGVLDGIATAKGPDLYASILYMDGTTEHVGACHLNRSSKDYAVLYEMFTDASMDDEFNYTSETGELQLTASPDFDVIVIAGPGELAKENEWLDATFGDLSFGTKGSNAIVLEFGDGGEFLAYAKKVDGIHLPTIKREAPTLWGRGSWGPLSISWNR